MPEDKLKRIILLDEPVSKDKFSGGGHSRTATALAQAIIEFKDKDRAIGIDGSWGSGKSTVIDIAQKKLKTKASNGEAINYHFCTFDIWKSQGAAFRRTFLEFFICWAKEQFPKQRSKLNEIEKKVSSKTKDVTTNSNPILDLYGFFILLSLPFLPIFYFWAKEQYKDTKLNSVDFILSMPMLVLIFFVITTLIVAAVKCRKHNLVSSQKDMITYGMALSRTLLITSKQYADQKITQHIRETDPNDFEFQNTFHEILKLIQDENNRVVLVLDNIDRIPSDELSEYWSIARSIFARNSFSKELSENTDEKTAITVIMPFDRNHVDGSKNQENKTPEKEELFSKTFNEILFVSPPVMSNTKEFFYEKFKEALPTFSKTEEMYGAYLVLNAYLEKTERKFTPRRIITFINELSSIYCMHKGKIPIVTVACYIAQREDIEKEPRILTSLKLQRDNLHSKLYKISKDKSYEKHLAAILFNVDSELAFQLLLDDELASAASSNNSEELIKLSGSPGFESRINEVVENKISDWIAQEELDQVAINFKILFEKYDGEATTHIKDELIDALVSSSMLIDAHDKDRDYFAFIDICSEDRLESLASNILEKSLQPFLDKEKAGFEDGKAFMLYVGTLNDALNSRNSDIDVQALLQKSDMPKETSSYTLGMASVCKQAGIHINKLDHIHIDLSSEDNDLIEHIRGNPTNCEEIFGELMRNKSLVTDGDWIKTANAVIKKLTQGKCEDVNDLEAFIERLHQIYLHVEADERKNIELKELFSNGDFYKLLAEFYEEESDDDDALPKLIFLLRQHSMSAELPQTNQQKQGTQQAEQAKGHSWLQKINKGEVLLNSDQYALIGSNVRKDLNISAWIRHGSANKDPLVDLVIKEALANKTVPRIPLATALKEYEYLKRTLDNEYGVFLQNYAQCIDKDALKKVELTEVPVGLLTDSKPYLTDGWDAFYTCIQEEYSNMPLSEWDNALTKAEHALELFFEIIDISDFQINTNDYKTALRKFIIQELQTPTDTYVEDVDYDDLFNAIPEKARGDWCRTLHENLTAVSQKGLINTRRLAQKTVKQILAQKPTTAKEKDNYVRHLMCNALEASEAKLLDCLLSFKREDILSIVKDCEDSTKQLLEQSLTQFMKSNLDNDTKKKLCEKIEGRKPKKYLEETYPSVYGQKKISNAKDK